MKTILMALFLPLCASGQSPFQQIWGDSSQGEKAVAVYQPSPDGIYVLGYSTGGTQGGSDMSLTKFDAQGNPLWHHYYGSHFEDYATNFAYRDGVFYIVGETHYNNANADSDAFISRVDTAGNLLSFDVYGVDSLREQFNSIAYDAGGWIISGFISDGIGNNDAYIVRMDGSDWTSPDWVRSYGSGGLEIGAQALPLPDGGYIVVGDKAVQGGNIHAYVLRLDAQGDLLWDIAVPFPYNSGSKTAIINSLGQLVIIGESATATSSYFDVFFVRMRTDAPVVLHSSTVPGSNKGDAGFAILERTPNDYVVTGYGDNEQAGNTDAFLMAIDSMGNERALQYFGTPDYDITVGLTEAFGGGFLLAGGAGGQYFLVYDDIAAVPTAVQDIPIEQAPLLYPNPADTWLQLPELTAATRLECLSATGERLFSQRYTTQLSVAELPAGVYLFRAVDASGGLLWQGRALVR